jgi:hypothetical protein
VSWIIVSPVAAAKAIASAVPRSLSSNVWTERSAAVAAPVLETWPVVASTVSPRASKNALPTLLVRPLR